MEKTMKKLLATTAVALVAMASTASAQSVLERVLGQIDNATNLASVNGTFANIAENIGSGTVVNEYTAAAVTTGNTTGVALGGTTQAAFDAFVARNTVAAVFDSVSGDTVYFDSATGNVIRESQYNTLSTAERAAFTQVTATNTLIQNGDGTFSQVATSIRNTEIAAREATIADRSNNGVTTTYTGPAEGVNGSITNIIDGITDATQTAVAGVVTAVEYNMPTMNFGNMATTALGAVNTGDITLGVNSSVDNAKTSSTEAVSSVMAQLGGSADTGAIVLNIASNMTGVNGSISNTMSEVNGTIGALSTTALGAVNTGTIISGVNAAVTGITGASAGQ
jgi:hypothetical protein